MTFPQWQLPLNRIFFDSKVYRKSLAFPEFVYPPRSVMEKLQFSISDGW